MKESIGTKQLKFSSPILLVFENLSFGTPSQIRTESQLLLRESALPISVTGQIGF